ncbi:MAG: tRNA1(Val) (adenine(37)-N6)-methyltransferase [Clostridia bacterium]|nr:tRNA1(Val) (adenine(37)-N6)-methyltransferase [Clostridia bacterium]
MTEPGEHPTNLNLPRAGERLDDLQRGGLHILQKVRGFRFGTDAVLLAHFAGVRPGDRVVDLGAGTGILPLLMSARCPSATFTAIELQAEMADMAARSVALNRLGERIAVREADLRDAPSLLGHGRTDLVVCNPPYSPLGAALANGDPARALARHEVGCTLAQVIESAGKLLRNGGRLAMVFPAQRLLELLDAQRAARVEPKRVRLVHQRVEDPPKLALVEGVKLAQPALHWLPPLILCDADGAYTAEARRVYGE